MKIIAGDQALLAHPRVSGENDENYRRGPGLVGSSPRERGKLERKFERPAPTLAHPRVSGENP